MSVDELCFNATLVIANSTDAAAAAAASARAATTAPGGFVAALGCSTEYVECRASRWLFLIVCPFMLATGTVGNFLNLLTMTSQDLRRTAFGIYAAALAATDSIAIWSALLRHFIKNAFLYDIRESSVWSCRIHRYIVYSSIDSSSWILVALTTGRLVSIRFPESSRHHKGAARARLIVPLIVAAQLVFNVPTLWMLGDEQLADGSTRHCGYPDTMSARYWQEVQPYASMAEASILPFVLMLSMNLAIVAALRRRMNGEGSVYRHSRQDQGLSGSGKAKTVMLLVISFVFLVTTVPTFINTVLSALVQVENKSAAKARMQLVDAVTTLLLYTNGSSNFFLYCLSGKMFRSRCRLALIRLRERLLCTSASTSRRSSFESSRGS